MGQKFQYCQLHKKVESYPSCATEYADSIRFSRKAAQLAPKDRPVVWEHPTKVDESGRPEVRFPGSNTSEMPQYYKDLGYKRKEFTSYAEHQKFNKERGLVNHAAEGIKDGALDD